MEKKNYLGNMCEDENKYNSLQDIIKIKSKLATIYYHKINENT